MQSSQLRSPVQATTPASRSVPVPLDPKDLQHVAGGLPRGGGWAPCDAKQLPRGGGWC